MSFFLILKQFARRALGKIENLARWERENDVPASRQTQRAFREASIKAGDTFTMFASCRALFDSCFPSFYFLLFMCFRLFSTDQLAAMLFKRLVFEKGKHSNPVFKPKSKSAMQQPPNVIP